MSTKPGSANLDQCVELPRTFLIVQCVIGLAGIAFLVSDYATKLSWQAVIFAHLSLVSVLLYSAFSTVPKKADVSVQGLCVFATLILGPIGSVGAVLLLLSLKLRRKQDDALEDWYDRLQGHQDQDPASEIYARLVTRRARRADSKPPKDFGVLMKEGELKDVQTLLGRIALDYDPEYFPILESALQCKEASIRVQAATIITKLRTHLKSRLKMLAESPSAQAPELSANLDEVRSCIASRLLEQSDTRKARALAKQLCHSLIEIDPARAGFYEATLCELLFEEGEYASVLARLPRLSAASESTERLRSLSLMKLGMHCELKGALKSRKRSGLSRNLREPVDFGAAA